MVVVVGGVGDDEAENVYAHVFSWSEEVEVVVGGPEWVRGRDFGVSKAE